MRLGKVYRCERVRLHYKKVYVSFHKPERAGTLTSKEATLHLKNTFAPNMWAKVVQYDRMFCIKQVDADVGVEQVNHLIFRRSFKATDGGRSSGTLSHFPKMSVCCGVIA